MANTEREAGILKRLSGIHRNMANDIWPNGATVTCCKCGRKLGITTEQCASYMAKGWPMCCELSMTLSGPTPDPERGEK